MHIRAAIRRGFTLIELLIVCAVISILTPAFFTVVIFTMRQEVEVRIGATLRQEGLSVVRAVMRDAHSARAARIVAKEPGENEMALILDMSPLSMGKKRRIIYRRMGARLERLVWADENSTPSVQTMSGHVRAWRVERSGDLVNVRIEVAIDRYAKQFTEKYAFVVRPGGAFDPSDRESTRSGSPRPRAPGGERKPG